MAAARAHVQGWAVETLGPDRIAALAAESRARLPLADSGQDLDWLTRTVDDPAADLLVLSDCAPTGLVGLAPFRITQASVSASAGPMVLYATRLKRYSLLRGPLSVRDNVQAAVSECLLQLAARMAPRSGVYFEAVPKESDLQRVLDDRSDPVHTRFFVMPWGPAYEHYKIKWAGKVETYLQSLNAKNRHNMKRAVKLAADKGLRTELKRFRGPGEIDAFFDDAVRVSEKTYQSRKLGAGLSRGGAREAMIRFAAERGGFLGHVLYINDQPAAFQQAVIYARTFYGIEMGYDPVWAQHQIGNVLFYRMLEDLERGSDGIDQIDMLTYDSVFKHRASNVRVPVQNYYLFPRTLAGRSIYWPLKGAMAVKDAGTRLADRLQLTERLKRRFREREKKLDEPQ